MATAGVAFYTATTGASHHPVPSLSSERRLRYKLIGRVCGGWLYAMLPAIAACKRKFGIPDGSATNNARSLSLSTIAGY